MTTESQSEKEDIAKLLRFESSSQDSGVMVGLEDYISRMPGNTHTHSTRILCIQHSHSTHSTHGT